MTTTTPSPFSNPAGTWNQRFQAPGFLFGTQPNTWLRDHASHWQPGQRVLCVADGEGRNSVWLARRGVQTDAFDISEVGVAKARVLARDAGVSVNFQISDCDAYPWPVAAYDGVAAIFIGDGDWASAWSGQAGVSDRQRELSLRFGVNLVMVALTGNYKADQVHVPALLERMGDDRR